MSDEHLQAIRARLEAARAVRIEYARQVAEQTGSGVQTTIALEASGQERDIAALLAEVERLRADLALAEVVIAHHVAELGLVEHDGMLVTPEEKDLLDR